VAKQRQHQWPLMTLRVLKILYCIIVLFLIADGEST